MIVVLAVEMKVFAPFPNAILDSLLLVVMRTKDQRLMLRIYSPMTGMIKEQLIADLLPLRIYPLVITPMTGMMKDKLITDLLPLRIYPLVITPMTGMIKDKLITDLLPLGIYPLVITPMTD